MSLQRPPRAKDVARKEENGDISCCQKIKEAESRSDRAVTVAKDGAQEGESGYQGSLAVSEIRPHVPVEPRSILIGQAVEVLSFVEGEDERNDLDSGESKTTASLENSGIERESAINTKGGPARNKDNTKLESDADHEEKSEHVPDDIGYADDKSDDIEELDEKIAKRHESSTRFGAEIETLAMKGISGADGANYISENVARHDEETIHGEPEYALSSKSYHKDFTESQSRDLHKDDVKNQGAISRGGIEGDEGNLSRAVEKDVGILKDETDDARISALKSRDDSTSLGDGNSAKEQQSVFDEFPPRDADQIVYSCSPENFASPKVKFQVGGDEDEDWQYQTQNDPSERRWDFDNGLADARKNQSEAHFTSHGASLSPSAPSERQRLGYNGSHHSANFDSSAKTSGRKRVSIELPRGIFDNHGKTSQHDILTKTRKRVSIEEPQDRKTGEIIRPSSHFNVHSSWGTPAAATNFSHGVNGGILKHSASAPRQYSEAVQSTKDLTDGLQRYRRRSQLTLSPDIPVDVPLKHRQAENEIRNKNNLEFIRQRVSMQEEQKLNQGLTVEISLGDDQDRTSTSSTPRSFSSPGWDTHTSRDKLDRLSDRPVRKSGLGHLSVSHAGFSEMNVPNIHDNYGNYAGYESNNTSPRYIGYDETEFTGPACSKRPSNNGATKNDENRQHPPKWQDKEPASVKHSREGSVASSTIVIEREMDEAEIVDYLGNIHPERRRYVFSTTRSHMQGPASPSLSDMSRLGEKHLHGHHQAYYTNQGFGSDGDDNVFVRNDGGNVNEEDLSMQPYVPIRRQRISFQDRAQTGHVWTVKGHDNQAYQAFPEPHSQPQRSPSHASSLDSLATGSGSTLDFTDHRISPCRIRKDSLAIFNSKLTGGSGRGRLRRLSQVSLEHIQQATRKNLELGRGELIRKYQLHVFVFLIFLVTVLSVSLSWHYRNLATQMLHASQAIFFNPRSRLLTLTGSGAVRSISGHVGLDMPSWQLPLHCPIVMGNNPHDKECVWKNNAILRIKQFSGRGNNPVECYKVSWESLHPQHVPHDCFDISDDLWYGPSNQSESLYPIKGKFFFSPSNYTVGNNGIFSSVVDFYWLSAQGAGLRVNADDPVQVFWNETGDNRLCILSNYTGPFYHQINHETAPHLNYTLCTGPDTLTTHTFMLSLLEPREKRQAPPPVSNLSGSHWSIRGHLGQNYVNQTHVIEMVERLQETGFESTKITLDSEWQAVHGDLKFDPERFPNVTEMFVDLSSFNCRLTLCVSPYFRFSSKNFEMGVAEGRFVQDAGGRVTGLADSEFGLAAVTDVTVAHVRDWLTERLRSIHPETDGEADEQFGDLLDMRNVLSLRLTYGGQEWLPYKPHFRLGDDATPNIYRRLMTETFSAVSSPLVVEHTSDSRHIPGLIPVQAKVIKITDKLCLTTEVIETALTLGLLGYPYVMVDGVSAENREEFSQELYIRWLELATLFPAHQHPTTPWQFKDANLTVAMAANLSHQNEALKMAVLRDQSLQKELSNGLPVVRPFWWNDSRNQTAHVMMVKDQFLLGGKLLVAPVLCEGVTSRDIHLPRGVWQDYHAPTRYVTGPVTIRDHVTPLGQTAVFKKVADASDMAGGDKHGGSL